MIILGVDPGIQHTGFAVIQAERTDCHVLQSGQIETDSSQLFELRLKTIYDQLNEIFKQHQIDFVVLEEIFYSRNIKIALKLGHARGVTLLVAANHHVPTAEYSAREIKQAVTGNGNASKYQVQQMISHLLKLSTIPSLFDITDAMAVAYCHSQRVISKIER